MTTMIELRERTEAHVRTYYEKTQDAHIKAMLLSAADPDRGRLYLLRLPSQKVLTANDFALMETVEEDGRESAYYQKAIKRNASQP